MNAIEQAEQDFNRWGIPTPELVGLALTLPVTDGHELFGRSHCWYSVAHTQIAAITYVIGRRDFSVMRGCACRALAHGGWTPAKLKEAGILR